METQERHSDAEVFILDDDELEEAKRSTLAEIGMTLEELEAEAEAESGRFRSERARMAWAAFQGLGIVERRGRRC